MKKRYGYFALLFLGLSSASPTVYAGNNYSAEIDQFGDHNGYDGWVDSEYPKVTIVWHTKAGYDIFDNDNPIGRLRYDIQQEKTVLEKEKNVRKLFEAEIQKIEHDRYIMNKDRNVALKKNNFDAAIALGSGIIELGNRLSENQFSLIEQNRIINEKERTLEIKRYKLMQLRMRQKEEAFQIAAARQNAGLCSIQ